MFVDLEGKRAIVIGGGAVALRRIRVLLEFRADVTVISPEVHGDIGDAKSVMRKFEAGDLDGTFIAVAATDERETNRAVGLEAKRLGIPVSVADCAAECTFFFPAVCKGAGLTAGIVSGGDEHGKTAAAAEKIRALLSEMEEHR